MKWRFWRWLFLGVNARPGIFKLLDFWLIVHVLVGFFLAYIIDVEVKKSAQTILLPLAGIFIGLSFAWVGSAVAVLQEREIQRVSEYLPDGIEAYVYTFQMAILIILITLVSWGLAGLGVFSLPLLMQPCIVKGVEVGLYILASLTLRECWEVVKAAQLLILTLHAVRKHEYKNR